MPRKKSSEPKKPKSKPKLRINKKNIVFSMVKIPFSPDKFFWTKEYSLLKKIMEKFPNEEFWFKVSKFIVKFEIVPSLAIHVANEYIEIRKKYSEFFYTPESFEEKYVISDKIGEDYCLSKTIRTVKHFLS